MATEINTVLVTGATGFIGAHIVDTLLLRGLTVRGATRSPAKGQAMIKARSQHDSRLSFVQIQDFESPGGMKEAVEGVDAIIHTASPFTYNTTNNEQELVRPAINGVRAVLEAANASPTVKRIVITSSFASVLDATRAAPPFFTYTGEDWNPLTWEETVNPETSAVIAYRGSKKFAELEAWKFVKTHQPQYSLVTLCPPMTFGPMVHPIENVEGLNESNAMLWRIASGEAPLPVARVPFWIDVRDLANAHVQGLFKQEAKNRRYTPSSPERFTYGLAAKIMAEAFLDLKDRITIEEQPCDQTYGLDGEAASKELNFEYHSFKDTVRDLITQILEMNRA